MRIIAGEFRGLALASVGKGDAGAHLRPTSDRVRESLFNVLNSRGVISGATVLDLFAGTGALGLEALSRGAASVTFVENGAAALKILTRNIALTRAEKRCVIVRRDATRLGDAPGDMADLVFLDPPYGKGLGAPALEAAQKAGMIAPGATIVWEEDAPQLPRLAGLNVVDQRRYGGTHVTIMEYAPEG